MKLANERELDALWFRSVHRTLARQVALNFLGVVHHQLGVDEGVLGLLWDYGPILLRLLLHLVALKLLFVSLRVLLYLFFQTFDLTIQGLDRPCVFF